MLWCVLKVELKKVSTADMIPIGDYRTKNTSKHRIVDPSWGNPPISVESISMWCHHHACKSSLLLGTQHYLYYMSKEANSCLLPLAIYLSRGNPIEGPVNHHHSKSKYLLLFRGHLMYFALERHQPTGVHVGHLPWSCWSIIWTNNGLVYQRWYASIGCEEF